jgi:hypothetical protein
VFQQDGDKVYTANLTMEFFDENNINVHTEYPAQSPDLNPIENAQARRTACGYDKS